MKRHCRTASLSLVLAIPALALGGPIVAIELATGERVEAEVRGYADGHLIVRNEAGRDKLLPLSQVHSVDFGETPREVRQEPSPPPSPQPYEARRMNLDELRRLIEEQRFPLVLLLLHGALTRTGPARLEELESQIQRELARSDLTPEARRDMRIAEVLVLHVLGRGEKVRAAFAALRRDYADDPVVRRLDEEIRRMRERGAERPSPRLPPERGRNEIR